jgi:uncharacterized membrane protein
MSAFWYFIHMLGYCLWIGGGLAVMAISIAVKREMDEQYGVAARFQNSIYRTLIGPGAMVTTVSGLIMTLRLYGQASAVGLSPWLMAMQGLGILGTLVVLLVAVPTSNKLSRLDRTGPGSAVFQVLRKRLIVAGMGSGLIAVLALVTSALYRYGR